MVKIELCWCSLCNPLAYRNMNLICSRNVYLGFQHRPLIRLFCLTWSGSCALEASVDMSTNTLPAYQSTSTSTHWLTLNQYLAEPLLTLDQHYAHLIGSCYWVLSCSSLLRYCISHIPLRGSFHGCGPFLTFHAANSHLYMSKTIFKMTEVSAVSLLYQHTSNG